MVVDSNYAGRTLVVEQTTTNAALKDGMLYNNSL
jgi:hypothetical protein